MKTAGSVKVVLDQAGAPWLVVGTDDGYEAQRVLVTERHAFRRSYQAVGHVTGPAAVDREVDAVHVAGVLAAARAELVALADPTWHEQHPPAWWVGHLGSVLRSVLEVVDEHTPSCPSQEPAA